MYTAVSPGNSRAPRPTPAIAKNKFKNLVKDKFVGFQLAIFTNILYFNFFLQRFILFFVARKCN